jgi:hypothetical protein
MMFNNLTAMLSEMAQVEDMRDNLKDILDPEQDAMFSRISQSIKGLGDLDNLRSEAPEAKELYAGVEDDLAGADTDDGKEKGQDNNKPAEVDKALDKQVEEADVKTEAPEAKELHASVDNDLAGKDSDDGKGEDQTDKEFEEELDKYINEYEKLEEAPEAKELYASVENDLAGADTDGPSEVKSSDDHGNHAGEGFDDVVKNESTVSEDAADGDTDFSDFDFSDSDFDYSDVEDGDDSDEDESSDDEEEDEDDSLDEDASLEEAARAIRIELGLESAE